MYEKEEMRKYWKQTHTKLEKEKKDLMDLYFSQTQSAKNWKAMTQGNHD